METVSYWISEIALLASGFIYVHTIEPREISRKRVWVNAVVYLLLAAFGNRFLMYDFWGVNLLFGVAGFLFVAHFLYIRKELSRRAAAYYAIWAFISWQLLYELRMIVKNITGYLIEPELWVRWIVEILIFVIGFTLIGFTIAKWMPDGGQKRIGPRQFLSAMLVFAVFEMLSYLQKSNKLSSGGLMAMYLTQILLVVILYLQNELFKKSEMKQELDMIKLLWKKEQEQYQISKENIALINQKCHDLKHQIRAIRDSNSEDKEKYLEEIEQSIQIYEAIVKTGNEVLDTILTEKSLYCKERGITVSCVVDGGQLEFINTIDLYSLLGNAIDNAIEAVEKIQNREMRQIDVLIYRQQQFLAINVVNPIEGNLIYEEEFPVTTKENKGYHGYGIKSMQYMLEKYDGFLSIAEEDGCFSLMMLIPIPKS